MKDVLRGKFIIVHNEEQMKLLLDFAKSLGYYIEDAYQRWVPSRVVSVYRFTDYNDVGRANRIGWYPQQPKYNCKEEIEFDMISNHIKAWQVKERDNNDR